MATAIEPGARIIIVCESCEPEPAIVRERLTEVCDQCCLSAYVVDTDIGQFALCASMLRRPN